MKAFTQWCKERTVKARGACPYYRKPIVRQVPSRDWALSYPGEAIVTMPPLLRVQFPDRCEGDVFRPQTTSPSAARG